MMSGAPGESLRFVGKEGEKLIWDESAPALFAVMLEAHCLEQALSRLGPSWNSSSCATVLKSSRVQL